jgi:hypothetical protein
MDAAMGMPDRHCPHSQIAEMKKPGRMGRASKTTMSEGAGAMPGTPEIIS